MAMATQSEKQVVGGFHPVRAPLSAGALLSFCEFMDSEDYEDALEAAASLAAAQRAELV